MIPKRPLEFVYVPRMWPAFAIASGVAAIVWALALLVGHPKAFVVFAGIGFCAGLVLIVLAWRRKVGFIPLALPSPNLSLALFRAGMGSCWGALLLMFLLSLLSR